MKIINLALVAVFLMMTASCELKFNNKNMDLPTGGDVKDPVVVPEENCLSVCQTACTKVELEQKVLDEKAVALEREALQKSLQLDAGKEITKQISAASLACQESCNKECYPDKLAIPEEVFCKDPTVEKVCKYADQVACDKAIAEMEAKCAPVAAKDSIEGAKCYDAMKKEIEMKGVCKQVCADEKIANVCYEVGDPVCKDVISKVEVCTLTDATKCADLTKIYTEKYAYCKTLGDNVKIKECIAQLDKDVGANKAIACAPKVADPARCTELKLAVQKQTDTCNAIGDPVKTAECMKTYDSWFIKVNTEITKVCATDCTIKEVTTKECTDGLIPLMIVIKTCAKVEQNTCSIIDPISCDKIKVEQQKLINEKCLPFLQKGDQANYDMCYKDLTSKYAPEIEKLCAQKCVVETVEECSYKSEQLKAFNADEALKAYIEYLKSGLADEAEKAAEEVQMSK